MTKQLVPWLSLSLWTAGLLSIARCTAALLNENFVLETEVEMALWRLTPWLWEHALFALAVGMFLSAVTRFVVQLNMIVWIKLGIVLAVAGAPCVYIVRGWSHVVLPDPVDPFSPFLPEAIQWLGITGAGIAALHTVMGISTYYLPGDQNHFCRWGGVFSGTLLYLAAPVLFGAWGRSTPPIRNYMQPGPSLMEDMAEVLARHGPDNPIPGDPSIEYEVDNDGPVLTWSLNNRHVTYPPAIGEIQPLRSGLGDGGRIRSLMMPPPCEIRFQLEKEAPPVLLRVAAGVDESYLKAGRVSFYVELNPQRNLPQPKIFNCSIQTDSPNERARGWQRGRLARYMLQEPEYQDLLEVDGIPIEPGDTVVLRTKYHRPIGMRVEDTPYIPAGFAEVRFDTRVAKKRRRPTPEEPNVLWIVCDALRADRLTPYGYEAYDWPSSPNLDGYAQRGLLYENAYATSSDTRTSTASLFTGRTPRDHGFYGDAAFLDNRMRTVAEVFSENGYWSVAFSCNPWINAGRNLDQGFDEFDDLNKFRSAYRVFEDVRKWLSKNKTTRFFLYVQLSESHHPYRILSGVRGKHGVDPPHDYPRAGIELFQENLLAAARGEPTAKKRVKKEHRRWMQRHYDMAVETTDFYVSGIVDLLERFQINDRTIVVITGSHGEELLDHGLVTHGHALWESLVRVPMIVFGPGIPARRIGTPVSNRHLAETLAMIAGGDLGLADSMDLLAPETVEERPVFFSTTSGLWGDQYPVELHGVRRGPWVLHYAVEPAELDDEQRVHLYHVGDDPGQRVDKRTEEPEVVRELLRILHAELAGSRVPDADPPPQSSSLEGAGTPPVSADETAEATSPAGG